MLEICSSGGVMKEKISILLIDDEEASRTALLILLKASGYSMTGVGTGRAALQALAQERFDIVITDLFLPDISGIEILKQIKTQAVPTEVILITGHASA